MTRELNLKKKEIDELKYHFEDFEELKKVDILKVKNHIKSSVEWMFEIKFNTCKNEIQLIRQGLIEIKFIRCTRFNCR